MKTTSIPEPRPLEPWQVIDLLRARVGASSQKDVAANLNLSPQYLSDILQGRRGISANVAKSLGLRKETTEVFWPINPEVKL